MLGSAVPRVCRAAIFGLAFVLLLVPISALASEDPPAIAGRVRDSTGNVLEGVELLVAAPSSNRAPLAVVTSDLLGRFSVARLAPGSYRIAAIKAGYLTAIGQVDTRLKQWVELVLHPMPSADEARTPLPRDGSWALRLPRRSIFRETDHGSETAENVEPDEAGGPQESLQMQVDHQFAYHALSEDDARAGHLQGNTTRLRLASSLGERGRLRLLGSHRSLDGGLDGKLAESNGPLSASTDAFRFDFSYDATADDQVAIEAFFRQEEVNWNDARPGNAGLHQSRRSWGYRSEWSRQLAPASVVAVEVDIQDRAYRVPYDKAVLLGMGGDEATFSNRTMGAGGSYHSVPGHGHELAVGFRAQRVDSPLEFDYRPNPRTLSTTDGVAGWTVQLEAQDAWSVSGPLTLVYGMGYRHSLGSTDTALIVPRFGGAVAFDRLAMRMMLAYSLVERSSSAGFAGEDYWSPPEQEIGYELDVELPLGSGVSLAGSLAYEPVQFESTGVDSFGDSAVARPIYHTDGNASMRRSSVALIQDLGDSTRTTLELSRGEVNGLVMAPGTGYAQLLLLSRRQLEYHSGQLSIRILPSGTDLQLEYRRTREQALADKLGGPLVRQEAFEIRLTQDLLRLRTMGDWRLLMGLRLASSKGADDDRYGEEADGQLPYTDALGHGVSAGLSVTF